jgi:3D (Asp-Asp-Asp) domain-containing protein
MTRPFAVRLLILGVLAAVVEGCAAHRPPITAAPPPPAPNGVAPHAMTFLATAYCHGTVTAAGVHVHEGIVAADPAVLPLGTVIHIDHTGRRDGVYTVMDTGPKVQGRRVDLFMRSCAEATRFGRRTVRVWIAERASHTVPE